MLEVGCIILIVSEDGAAGVSFFLGLLLRLGVTVSVVVFFFLTLLSLDTFFLQCIMNL